MIPSDGDSQEGPLPSALPCSGSGLAELVLQEPRAHPARGRAPLPTSAWRLFVFHSHSCPAPPLLSSLHLHRPKNRARLGLGLISLWGILVGSHLWPDKVGTGHTRVPQMPLSCYRSGCSGLPAPLTFALDTFPCSLPKMLNPGHGGCQAEPCVSPCVAPLLHLGWARHQLQRCPCGTGRAERYSQSSSSYSPKVPGVRKWSHRDALVTWLGLYRDLALPPGQLWVPRGCSRGFHPSCSPGRLIPSASGECGAG